MKKKSVYLFKVQPKGYNNAIELSFGFIPAVSDIIGILNEMIENTKREELKELCRDSIAGIQTWGLPKVTDNSGNYIQWKTKGESLYSSKGVTIIKPITCYVKG